MDLPLPSESGCCNAESPVNSQCDAIDASPRPLLAAAPDEAEQAEERLSRPQRPNFSGAWLLSHVEGDMPALLREQGVRKAVRALARLRRYGRGKTFHLITQHQKLLQCEVEVATHCQQLGECEAEAYGQPCRQLLRIDGREREEFGLEGATFRSAAAWDKEVLVLRTSRVESDPETGQPVLRRLPTSRRYLDGDDMVVEYALSNGYVARTVFTRH